MYFVTGNKGKFEEAKAILGKYDLEQKDIDLPEIQSLDPKEIIKAKLEAAYNVTSGELIVDDVAFYLECLNGLPGPLIKWFLKTIGNEGLVKIAKNNNNLQVRVLVTIGYAKSKEEIIYFEDTIEGKVVDERGENGFGFDKIFEIPTLGKTLAELTIEEKNKIYPRGIALMKLKKYLDKNNLP
ncbi:non-canonical purine NTP pyrophosphatase [Candidatus Woesebacteria bacterium]|nr:MAG: non-canonical purine NTP pyrophosphatase [Candidatus Woesebacteria bacterium]